ncbi:MAG: TonB-dependent receptor, partial [Paracoccaceae bacterium]
LPGVSVTQSGPIGSTSTLRVRGADGKYLAVFVDGIKLSDPSGTSVSFDWGSLMTGDIALVEVLRGSQSALWGGSAVGGVINITTRAGIEDGLHQSVTAEGGSYGTGKLSYGLTQKDDRMELAFTATRLHTEGFSAFDGGTERDGADATRLSFSARYKVSDSLTLGGAAFWQDTDQDYDGYIDTNADTYPDTLTDLPNTQARSEKGARIFAEFEGGSSTHLFELSALDIERTLVDENGTNTFGGSRLTLGYTGNFSLSDNLSLVYGLDWSRETATYGNLPSGKASTEIAGAFAQLLWAPSDVFDLSATLRADHNSDFGTFSTGRLALAWRPAEGTTMRATYATGFRAPSLDERFGDYPSLYFTGNSALVQEESESLEFGIEQTFSNGATVSLTAFQLNVDNLVSGHCFDLNDGGTPADLTDDFCNIPYSLMNLPGVSTRKGVEIAASLPVSDAVTFGLAYTYTDGRRPDDSRLTQVPFHQLSLTLDADLSDRLTAGLALTHVAGRMDNDANTFLPVAMPDYTVLAARVSYDLNDTTEAYLKLDNLLDEDYQQVNGYAAAGRSVYLGIQAKF